MHGGIGPELDNLNLIDAIPKPTTIDEDKGLMTALLWSDPHDEEVEEAEWEFNQTRNVGWLFGKKAFEQCLRDCNILMIVRAHQVAMDGYEFKFDKRLVTVFSAPNYELNDNHAAVLRIKPKTTSGFDKDNVEVECSIHVLNQGASITKTRTRLDPRVKNDGVFQILKK
jgi:hypothetical protein